MGLTNMLSPLNIFAVQRRSRRRLLCTVRVGEIHLAVVVIENQIDTHVDRHTR